MPRPGLTLLAASLLAAVVTAAEPYDLLIRNGRIADGTGNPAFRGDVAVRGGRVVAVGRVPAAAAKREIDATGLVVAPGFIDIHSHSEWLLLEDGDAQSKVRQGVTTEVFGENDSPGPSFGKIAPKSAAVAGKRVEIASLGEYFDAVERAKVSVNVCSYVGSSSIRRCVMGDSFDKPTGLQMALMKTYVAEAMRDGAFGLSSMLAMPPGSLFTEDELVELCKVVRDFGGIYSTHTRNEGTAVFEAVKEAIAIGERAGVPVDVIHLKIADEKLWGKMDGLVAIIEAARRRGVDVQANCYPYTRGSNNLASIIPPWAHEGGREAMLARLKDAKLRERMKRDIREGLPGWYNHYTAVGGDWSRMLIADRNDFSGQSMDKVLSARAKGKTPAPDPLDEFFDFLIEQNGSVATVFAHHTDKDMHLAMSQPWCSVGSDGLAYADAGPLRRGHPHPRSFGTFPRVLADLVRDRGLLRLEDAVRKMTSLNAAKLGIRDRGLLREGAWADITIFDPDAVKDFATYEQPFQYPTGIPYVIVNGKLVIDGGKHTGARPGRAIRHEVLAAAGASSRTEPVTPTETIRLFNGKDLTGFTTWLADTKREDPRGVFTVADGMLHVSGEGMGYAATDKEYRDYRLTLEFKWGKRTDGGKYVRNSGILLHATGPDGGAGKNAWMSCIECQLAQGCVGDLIVIRGKDERGAAIPVAVTAETELAPDGKRRRWKKGGESKTFPPTRGQLWWGAHDWDFKELIDTRGKDDVESPVGEWTKLEVVADGKALTIVVNGTVVNHCTEVTPAAGKILLQCEGFEVYFRKVELHPLKK